MANILSLFLVSLFSLNTITVNGLERRYGVYISQNDTGHTPVIFVLHGGGGSIRSIKRMVGNRFEELAEEYNFVIVYPEAYKRHWNDGRGIKKYDSHRLNLCDVCFINAIIDTLQRTLSIDTTKIFATGISNGGIMSMRLACDPSSRIKKIAPVAMLLTDKLSRICKMPHPTGVMIFIGTDDPLVPWRGGHIHFGRRKLGNVVSYDSTISFFAHINGCKGKKETSTARGVWKISYEKCKPGAETVMYVLQGGGHTWPGGKSQLPAIIVGKTINTLDATDSIVRFFLCK